MKTKDFSIIHSIKDELEVSTFTRLRLKVISFHIRWFCLIVSGVFSPSSAESVFRLILGFTCWCCTRDRKSLVYFLGFSIDTVLIHFAWAFPARSHYIVCFLKSTIWSDIALQLQAFAYRLLMILFYISTRMNTMIWYFVLWFANLFTLLYLYVHVKIFRFFQKRYMYFNLIFIKENNVNHFLLCIKIVKNI